MARRRRLAQGKIAMSEKKERAFLDPQELRDKWTRIQRLRGEVDQIYGITYAIPEESQVQLPREILAGVRKLHEQMALTETACYELLRSVLIELGNPDLIMPPKKEAVGFAAVQDREIERVCAQHIESLGLSVRSWNALEQAGLILVGQVAATSSEGLLCLRHVGRMSHREIQKSLKKVGLHLAHAGALRLGYKGAR
jgi:hypothetical protein